MDGREKKITRDISPDRQILFAPVRHMKDLESTFPVSSVDRILIDPFSFITYASPPPQAEVFISVKSLPIHCNTVIQSGLPVIQAASHKNSMVMKSELSLCLNRAPVYKNVASIMQTDFPIRITWNE
jgi:hypothetical protein